MKVVFFSVLSSTPAFLSRTVSHKQLPKNTSQPYKICYRKACVTATGFKSLIKKKFAENDFLTSCERSDKEFFSFFT